MVVLQQDSCCVPSREERVDFGEGEEQEQEQVRMPRHGGQSAAAGRSVPGPMERRQLSVFGRDRRGKPDMRMCKARFASLLQEACLELVAVGGGGARSLHS